MPSQASRVVLLATGGTIAGRAARATDNLGYTAAQLGADELLAAVPALGGVPLDTEEVAQLDSKDLDAATWQRLAARAWAHLARPEVAGLVVTHGTDTLEETAWFLQRVLAPAKPVVLTGAMRPSTSLQADGPQNLLDAVTLATLPGVHGVLCAFGGAVLAAEGLRKRHGYRLDAFGAGDAGVLGWMEEGRLRSLREMPRLVEPLGLAALGGDPSGWPWVEVVWSRAAADARAVSALVDAGVRGLVVAGTGNGTVHRVLDEALRGAEARGVRLLRTTRCAEGRVVEPDGAPSWPEATPLPPAQARVELLLRLLAGR